MMFDPGAMNAARASQAAVRRATEMANGVVRARVAAEALLVGARLSVREAKCFDPDCVPVETVLLLMGPDWSVTTKVLKEARHASTAEVEAAADDVCRRGVAQALARRARLQVASNSEGVAPAQLDFAETFAAKMLAALEDQVRDPAQRQAVTAVLGEALRARSRAPSSSDPPATDPQSPSQDTSHATPPVPPPATARSAPRARVAPTPPTSGGPQHLREADEAAAMSQQHKPGQGGLKCPCCNPDSVDLMVDMMLMS